MNEQSPNGIQHRQHHNAHIREDGEPHIRNAKRPQQQDRASNDTLLWWTGPEHILLQSQGNNRYMFTVMADTMLRKDDLVRCTFRTSLHHRSGQQQGVAVLVANYEGDSVAVTHQLLYATGNQTISVRIHSARKVRSIQGFVYLVSPWWKPTYFEVHFEDAGMKDGLSVLV